VIGAYSRSLVTASQVGTPHELLGRRGQPDGCALELECPLGVDLESGFLDNVGRRRGRRLWRIEEPTEARNQGG
jgi:hypothetical protein